MSFKENLLAKIEIQNLADRVIQSIGPPDAVRKFDKDAMRAMMALSPYTYRKERDLELFVKNASSGKPLIFVLDNELKLFNAGIEDVVMRKSPTLKEMLSIRNAVKILNDSDIVTARKERAVILLRDECIAALDLTYRPSDIHEIAREGAEALQREYAEGVVESIMLLAELLHFKPPPPALKMAHHWIFGGQKTRDDVGLRFGPLVVYSLQHNVIRLIDEVFDPSDKRRQERFKKRISGKTAADLSGAAVFDWMKQQIH